MLPEMPADLPARKISRNRPPEQAVAFDPEPETICYRGQALALVRHFFEMSCQLGRLPSILGREFFRAKVSHHAIPSFEDQAVFVRDVELCIGKLTAEHQEVIMLAGLYNFTYEEVAQMLHTTKASIHTWFAEALDALSEIFLKAGLLNERRPDRRQRQMTRARCRARSRTGSAVSLALPSRKLPHPAAAAGGEPEENALGAVC